MIGRWATAPVAMLMAATLSGCGGGHRAPAGRQEKEAGAGEAATAPINDVYIARLMGETGFDLRRCQPSLVTPPADRGAARRQCLDRTLAREDAAVRDRIGKDHDAGQINDATMKTALALQARRLGGARTSAQSGGSALVDADGGGSTGSANAPGGGTNGGSGGAGGGMAAGSPGASGGAPGSTGANSAGNTGGGGSGAGGGAP